MRSMAFCSNSSIGRALIRSNTPSAVAETSATLLSVVGMIGFGSPAMSISAGGASGTSVSSTFNPPVRIDAVTRRARRPAFTCSLRKSSAASGPPSPSSTPSRPDSIDRVAANRTRLSPNRCGSTMPFRAATFPICSPLSVTAASGSSPATLSSKIAVRFSTLLSSPAKMLDRAAASSL